MAASLVYGTVSGAVASGFTGVSGACSVSETETGNRRFRIFAGGYAAALILSYVISSAIRVARGVPARDAWTPNSALIGVWVGVALCIITFPFIMRAVSAMKARRGA